MVSAVADLLPGALVSSILMTISASNTGGAWDNAKKYIEAGFYRNEAGEVKKNDKLKNAVMGYTVDDPLKDIMAIFSLVLAETLCKTEWQYQGWSFKYLSISALAMMTSWIKNKAVYVN